MSTCEYELVVVGAGIHGAGAAQAAAAAGHRVLVLEQTAVAAGTSSRSSKLIHGGLRYLETGEFSLVWESLHERAILLRTAPKLVRLIPFHIPIYADTGRRPWKVRVGLSVYALLAGLTSQARFQSLPRAAWNELDGLKTKQLQAVFRYLDGQTDDARLTRAVMRSAESLGAKLICPARFVSAQAESNGWSVNFSCGGEDQTCSARTLVNAAGPWVNQVAQHVTPSPAASAVELVQGTHIVVEGELKQGAYYVEAPRDRRAVFIMPRPGGILVGTTESVFVGDPALAQPQQRDIDYLLETLQHYFPTSNGKILDSFTGLRVLPKGERRLFHRTREVVLVPDIYPRPRLISVYGGKLTSYRSTAAKILRALSPRLPKRKPVADTAKLMLAD